jgi:histidinol-phosphate aminotransferase
VSLDDRDESEVIERLGERGVVVRSGASLGGSGHLRVTYGTRHENARFLDALAAAIA